jgi:hypothetical protein
MVDEERRINCSEALREMHESMLEDHKVELASLTKDINLSREFRGQVKIAAVILFAVWTSVWIGSFVYTYNYKVQSTTEHNNIHRVVNDNVRDIGRLDGKVLVVEDRYSRLITDIQKLDSKTERIINMLNDAHTPE